MTIPKASFSFTPAPRVPENVQPFFAALHTFTKGGAVYARPQEQLPDEAPICAVFRY